MIVLVVSSNTLLSEDKPKILVSSLPWFQLISKMLFEVEGQKSCR